jgi:hypothetical protein
MIVVVAAQDNVVIQVPASWSPNQVSAEQQRVNTVVSNIRFPAKVLIVGGGNE